MPDMPAVRPESLMPDSPPLSSQPERAAGEALSRRGAGRAEITLANGRLAAIAQGKEIPPEIHPAVRQEPSVVDVQRFNLWYGEKQALFDISLGMPKGKVTAIIGPSGCGKSTLLPCVNRMNDLLDIVRIKGEMLLNGDSIYNSAVDVIELRKRMGMVFQK